MSDRGGGEDVRDMKKEEERGKEEVRHEEKGEDRGSEIY